MAQFISEFITMSKEDSKYLFRVVLIVVLAAFTLMWLGEGLADTVETKEVKAGTRTCVMTTVTLTDSICTTPECVETDKVVNLVCEK